MQQSLVIIGAAEEFGTALMERMRTYLAPDDCPIDEVRFYAVESSPRRSYWYPFRRVFEIPAQPGYLRAGDHVIFCATGEKSNYFYREANAEGCRTIIDLADLAGAVPLDIGTADRAQIAHHEGTLAVRTNLKLPQLVDQVARALSARVPLRDSFPSELRYWRRSRVGAPSRHERAA